MLNKVKEGNYCSIELDIPNQVKLSLENLK